MEYEKRTLKQILAENTKEELATKLLFNYKRIESLEKEVQELRKDLVWLTKPDEEGANYM